VGSETHLHFTVAGRDGDAPLDAVIGTLVVAGWTGRDAAAMEAHIRELEELGIPRPKATPIFYRVAATLLTNADTIQVSGTGSSGEAETVVLNVDGTRFVGVGSDHTDREAEKINVSLSKQMCAKPVSPTLWRFDDIADHWDELVLRSWAHEGGGRRLYQEGPVTAMRSPDDLIGQYGGLQPGAAMYGGTLAFAKPVATEAQAFEVALEDPVLGRTLTHTYRIETLPVEG
jgi:hypothetical protein